MSVRCRLRPDDCAAGEHRFDAGRSQSQPVLDVLGARECGPGVLRQERPAEEHAVPGQAGGQAEHGAPGRPYAVDEEKRGATQRLLRGAVLEEQRLALHRRRTFLEPVHDFGEKPWVRRGVRIHHDDCARRVGAGEELVDRPRECAPLASSVRHVADQHLRAGIGCYTRRLIGAVVRYDNDLDAVGRILLLLERPDAPGDRALFVVGGDQHDDVRLPL